MNKRKIYISGKITGDRVFRRGMNDGDGVSLNRQATGRGGRYLEAGK